MHKLLSLVLAFALLASICARADAPSVAARARPSTYVIYYGWLTDSARGAPNAAARRIAAAAPPIVIVQPRTAAPAGHVNVSPQVLALMHGSGTTVYAYVSTRWSRTDLAHVIRSTDDALATGADGILFDEADPLCTDLHYDYYRQLSERVRAQGRRVILNTGVTSCGPRIMDLADYVMLEHQWRATTPWMGSYSPDRFMGVSSNEGRAMGYFVDERRALADTIEAWKLGIGWHASTDRFAQLPYWFARYAQSLPAYEYATKALQ